MTKRTMRWGGTEQSFGTEYRTVSPGEKMLAEELKRTRLLLEGRVTEYRGEE